MHLGKLGKGGVLVHELGSAFMIICGEFQSKHFKGGGGEF